VEYEVLAFFAAALTAVITAILLVQKSRKKGKTVDYQATIVDHESSVYSSTIVPGMEARNMAAKHVFANGSKKLASFLVISSDDDRLVNKQISIKSVPFSMGRSKENELAFPKDYPVSRNHAVIDVQEGVFNICEVSYLKNGELTLPAFGTFVNGIKVEQAPVLLNHGDEIRLGIRLRIRFLIEE
jgi:hypothetical protein